MTHWLKSLVCVWLCSLRMAPPAVLAETVTEDFEAWPVTDVWMTQTNAVGWVLRNGSVRDRDWYAPHEGSFSGWLGNYDASAPTWLSSPLLLNGAGTLNLWAASYSTGNENLFAVQTSTNGTDWVTTATIANVGKGKGVWTAHTNVVNQVGPVYLRLLKTGQAGRVEYLGLDAVSISEPPPAVLSNLLHEPATPTVADSVDVFVDVRYLVPGVSNAVPTLFYRFDGRGPYVTSAMTHLSNETYRTQAPVPAGRPGLVEYYVVAAFEGWSATVTVPEKGPDAPAAYTVTGNPYPGPADRAHGPSSRRTFLAISEIHYHPETRADGRELEFIELFNSDPIEQDISGYRLSGDIDFRFPAGTVLAAQGRLVVAKVPSDISDLFPVSHVLGPYSNRLSNAGGVVRLRNTQDALLLDVKYSDGPPWPISTDGAGHSLVLARPDYGESDARAWSPSACIGGSPGTPEPVAAAAVGRVVINEFLAHTDLPYTDYIELFNTGPHPVDISGWVLTDNADTNSFVVPAGTTLSGGSFISFDQATLGFSLSMHGDDIYLVDTNASRVVDAVRFQAQERHVSSGRYPDGAEGTRVLASLTPSAPNDGLRPRDIVINEIMYHPISSDPGDEYVELLNVGTQAVDLSHWRLTEGVTYAIPAGTALAPGGFLVIARDAARLISRYPHLNAANTIGNWSGQLSDGGESVVLGKPDDPALPEEDFVVMDSVTYSDGWGRWADGNGSSLELIDPRADNRCGMNWDSSDETDKAPWTQLEYTGSLDYGQWPANECHVFALQAGEFLLDDLEIADEGGRVYVSADFEGGQGAWQFLGNHTRSRVENGTGYGDSRCVRVRASGKGDNSGHSGWSTDPLQNRVAAPLTSVPPAGMIMTARARIRWQAGWPYAVVALRGNWLQAVAHLKLPETPGTPGLPNSRAAANAGPAIYDVEHTPAMPAANEPVMVTCRVQDPDGISALTLRYRLDPSTTVSAVAMKDDGSEGDAVAGDGLYSALISGQPSGRLVAFEISAVDAALQPESSRFPPEPPPEAPARECLVRFGHAPNTTEFDSYHMWLTAANVTRWQTINGTMSRYSNEPIDVTVIYNGERIIYNAGARWRGLWRNFNDPQIHGAYSIDIPKQDRLLGQAEIKIDQPGQSGGDATLQRENFCFAMARQTGVPGCHVHYVHVTVNGSYRGIRHDLLTPSLDFCSSWFNDDSPTVFKDVGWTGDPFGAYKDAFGRWDQSRYRWNLRKRRTDPPDDDFSPVYKLASAFAATGDAYTDRVSAVLDIRGWLSYFALNAAVGGWDAYGYSWCHNMFAYVPRHRGAAMFIYDLDFSLDGATTVGLFPTDSSRWPVAIPFCQHPPFRRAYWRFLRDIAEGPFDPERANAHFDNWYAAFLANGVTPTSPDALKSWIASRRAFILSQLDTVASPFEISTNGGRDFSTASPIITLAGRAPVEVATMRVNGAPHAVRYPAVNEWSMQVALEPAVNALLIEGVGEDGNTISNDTVSVTFTAQPPSPSGQLVINEIQYNPIEPGAEFVEIYNRSANETFHLGGMRLEGVGLDFPAGTFIGPKSYVVVAESRPAYAAAYGNAEVVVAEYPGSLDGAGETLRLLMPDGGAWSVLDEVTYSPHQPWPWQADGYGPSLQLIDPEQDNNRIGNWAASALSNALVWTRASLTVDIPADGISGSKLHVYLDAEGEAIIDGVSLVEGSLPGVGDDLVRNGGFELPLAGTWIPSASHDGSFITTDPAHDGSGALHLMATGAGTWGGRVPQSVYQSLPTLPGSTRHTLSFWYYPTVDEHVLTAIIPNSGITLAVQTRFEDSPPTPYTPGAANTVRANLPPFPELWINEVMPSNTSYMADNVGDFDPWVELYNNGTTPIDLGTGIYLSDSYGDLTRWALPEGLVVAAGERLLLWADGEEHETAAGAVHTSFRLNGVAGAVVLARRESSDSVRVLDSVDYVLIPSDRSYGSYPEGARSRRLVFHHPTPGEPNSPTSQVVQVVINEWMSDNEGFHRDPADNQYEDWFELYNAGDQTAFLGGYRLSDDPQNPALTVIPGGFRIPSRSHLLVWADGDPEQSDPGGDLHVDFGLNKNGDTILLTAPDGSLVDRVDFGPLEPDTADGCWRDGERRPYKMTPPTPRGTNRTFAVVQMTEQARGMSLTWLSEAGRVYDLRRVRAITDTNWLPVGVVTATAATATCTDTNSTPASRRFYRLLRRE